MAAYVLDDTRGQLQSFTWAPFDTPGSNPVAIQAPILIDVRDGARLDQAYLLVASHGRDLGMLSSYHIDPLTGALTLRDQAGAADGLGIRTPAALESLEAFGKTWVVLAGQQTQSLSVLQLADDGTLVATDHLLDTHHTRFGAVQALAVLETDGHAFVVAGGGDDGLSLFRLLPSGRLIHEVSLADRAGLGLQDITALELVRAGNALQIFASSEGAAGVAQFTVSLANAGQVIRDADPGANDYFGGAGDDLLVAGSGDRDRLFGGAGDDTLVASDGATDLTGGSGADLFVLSPAQDVLRIHDFETGSDRLDLSGFPMLRDPNQVRVSSTGDGARLTYGDTTLRLFSATGGTITRSDLWPDGRFHGADHFPVARQAPPFDPDAIPQEGRVTGGKGADTITGTYADEMLTGGGGADTFLVRPGMGVDTVADFVRGEDRLDFSALDAAQLTAMAVIQQGGDRVISVSSHSALIVKDVGPNSSPGGSVTVDGWLGVGQRLQAQSGVRDADGLGRFDYQWYRDAVAITGATGASYTLRAADLGATLSVEIRYRDGLGTLETVTSASTATIVAPVTVPDMQSLFIGTAGRDLILSGPGGSTVRGDAGDDTLLGGSAADDLAGGLHRDAIVGGFGDDSLWGGLGNDSLWGEEGHDRIDGGDGDDVLSGYTGNDFMTGGAGLDRLVGGGGADTLDGGDDGDMLFAGSGADLIMGKTGSDSLRGGAGRGGERYALGRGRQ